MTTILIAEDDVMIADYLEEILVEAGYSVCGIARTVVEAVKLGRACRPDLAVLDLHLNRGELGSAIVPFLNEGGRLGVLYATGNDTDMLTQADGDVCIRKPYLATDVLKALRMVQQIVAGTELSLPLPAGVHVLS